MADSIGHLKLEDKQSMEKAVTQLLKSLGEDPTREGLLKTPHRVAKSLEFLTKGYAEDAEAIINGAIFHEPYSEIILVKDIPLYSLCEHHLLPFVGKAHVAYIPDQRIVGLSKIARVVEVFSRRLQVQERLTQEIANTIQKTLQPQGTAVVIEAEHFCMQMRGVQKVGSVMITSSLHGMFLKQPATREEFMSLIRNGK